MAETSPRFSATVLLLTLAVSIALVLGFFGWLHPALDAFSHFRLHLTVLLLACGIALLSLGQRLHAFTAFLLSAACVAVTAPYLSLPLPGTSIAEATPPADQPVYKLLQLNVYHGNAEPKAVLSLIARQHPDIVVLEEVTDRWRGELDLIRTAYPYKVDCREGFISTVILSRRPMDREHNSYCSPDGGVALAQIDLHGRIVDLLAIHLPWPWPFDQADMIEAHAPLLHMLGDTAIVAGDLNAVPWSAAARKVMALGGFARIERVGPTWLGHHGLPETFKFLGLPIDNVMSKGRVIVHSARTLERVGSDHLPVLVEFSLASLQDEPQPTQTVWTRDTTAGLISSRTP